MDSLEIESPYSFPEDDQHPPLEQKIRESRDVIDIDDCIWGEVFRDHKLKPIVTNKDFPQARQAIQPNSDQFWDQLDRNFYRTYANIEPTARDDHYITISNAGQLSSATCHWHYTIGDWRRYQNRRLCGALHKAKLVDNRTEPVLRDEIDLRRKQYPDQRIYLFVSSNMAEYLDGVGYGSRFEDAVAIQMPSYSPYGSPSEWRFGDWLCAVVAHEQLKVNWSFHYTYHIEKIPRWWRIQYWMYQKFAIKVDPRCENSELIREGPEQPTRFSMIEI